LTIDRQDQKLPYITQEQDGKINVVDKTGRTLVSCRDKQNAEHYAALMNQAYAAGLRAARQKQSK